MYFFYFRNLRDKDTFSKSDPVCVVLMKGFGQNSFSEVFRTERIKDSLNPQWVKKFEVDYRFEERQVCFLFNLKIRF